MIHLLPRHLLRPCLLKGAWTRDPSFMEHVEIPATVILEAMMKKLHLPCPEYRSKCLGEDCFMSEVMFYPSMPFLQSSAHPHVLESYPAESLEEAMNDAALQAIKYMKDVEKKVPTDFRHVEVKKKKKMARILDHKLNIEHRKFVRKANQLVEVMVTCNSFIEQVHDSACRIKEIVSGQVSPGYTAIHDKHNAKLLDIQNVATDLSKHAVETTRLLEATGAFSSEDNSVTAESSGCHGSELDNI